MKRVVLVLCFFFIQVSIAQEVQEKEVDIVETALSGGENIEENLENENIIEDLFRLKLNPIPINDTAADFTLLYQYNLLTPLQAEQLKHYIRIHGELLTKKELYAVPFISYEQADRLSPYVAVIVADSEVIGIKDQLAYSRKTLIIRNQYLAEQQTGFRDVDSLGSRFAGDRNRLYFKYRQQYRDQFSFSLLGDKDAGEPLFRENNAQGFDFYSAHLYYKPQGGLVQQAVIGDYEIKIGQGLVQWNGFALGKGSDASAVFLKGPRIRPYTSSNEFNFFRGGSTELRVSPNVKTQIWYSNKNVDANRNELDTIETQFVEVTSLQLSGLHRTKGEIEDKRSVNEQVGGVNFDYEGKWFTVGLLGQHRQLSDSLVFSGRDYQRFLATGTQFQHASFHYSGLRNNVYFFGETAISNYNALATTNGVQKFFDSGLKATLVYRNFAPTYQSFYASSLSENTTVNNEEAVYLGMTFSPAKSIKIQTYFDRFWFPWNKARVDRPSGGTELFLRAEYFGSATELELRSRIENKDVNEIQNTDPNNNITTQQRITNRFEVRHRPTNRLYFKSRVGHTAHKTSQKNEHGFLIFQDVVYDFPQQALKLYSRLSAFHTPSFDSRIYAYENDLLYNFSVPAYYGEGIRWYAMASLQPRENVKLWVKGSQTIFSDREKISSGNNEIEGNTRTDLKVQVQWRF